MNESPPNPSPPAAPAPAGSSRFSAVWAGVLLALLAVAGVWLENRARIGELEQTVARRLSTFETSNSEARGVVRDNQDALRGLQERIGALSARIESMQGQQAALDQLYQEFARTRDDRLLAEIEHAITIANQQLQLAGNVGAALLALQAADNQLARADRAHFMPLRKALNRDIDRLRALPAVDVPGMTLKLESLLAGVDALPLAFERKPSPPKSKLAPTEPGVIASLWAEIWWEIRHLIRIERMDRPDPGLLAPTEVVFLRENLKLRLLDARLALLARDDRVFKEDIKQSRAWVERYFDGSASLTQAALESLEQLNLATVSIELPVLTESLAALKSLQLLPARLTDAKGGR